MCTQARMPYQASPGQLQVWQAFSGSHSAQSVCGRMEDHNLKVTKDGESTFYFHKTLNFFFQHSGVAAPGTRNTLQCELFPKRKVHVRIQIIFSSTAAACTAKGELMTR